MQRAKIEQYCQLNDMELVEIIEDAAISAKDIKHRPGIQSVLEMVKAKQVDAVVIYKLDRLARNTVECLEMAQLMDRAGVALHSFCEKLDTQSAIGRFFFTLTASLAAMEREVISERTTAAMQRKRQLGESTGQLQFGYRLAPDGIHVEPEPSEQVVIGIVVEMKGNGHSFRKIARKLNEDGYKTKENRSWTHRQVASVYRRAA
jgi:site-specific DNA recombinase